MEKVKEKESEESAPKASEADSVADLALELELVKELAKGQASNSVRVERPSLEDSKNLKSTQLLSRTLPKFVTATIADFE